MDLKKFLPGHEKEEPVEYFWSLIIEPGWVQAGIWRIKAENAQIINRSAAYPWELEDELVNSADTALSGAIQGFPEGLTEPSKTVFGVISTWVTDGQIKDDYLSKIKRVCSDLSLTPMGFVVIPEAISHLLKSQEQAPLSAVLIGVYKETLEVSVFKLGNLLGTTQITRSLSIIDDVTEGVSRFSKGDAMPSRFILYGGKESELEDTQKSLSNVSWEDSSNIPFLHTPKVEVFTPARKTDAICLAGASEVSGVTNLEGQEEPEKGEEELPMDLAHVDNISKVRPEDVGFVVDHDIAESIFEEKSTFLQNPFSRGKRENETEITNGQEYHEPEKEKGVMDNLSKKWIFVPLILLVLLLGSFAAWWYFPMAVVTLYISPRQLDEKVEITVDREASASTPENKVLAGEPISTTVKGEKTKPTSGTKTVGDKATGEVTLYRVGTELSLKSGTALVGPNKLRFVLDEDVSIESGSASTPGTTTAKVTAETIGAEYNLDTGTSFTVGNYTTADIEAKNTAAFTGGSSREISAVSADDQKSLETELTAELKEKAKEEITATISDDTIFIDESLTISSPTKEFSQKVGDEAKSLGLTLSLSAEAVTVKRADLLSLAQESVKEKIPQGFVLREDQIDTSFEFVKKDGNSYKFAVLVSANLLPEIKTDEIAGKIRGKNPEVAREYLIKEVAGFARAEIVRKPSLPGRLGTLPQVASHIQVEVAAER